MPLHKMQCHTIRTKLYCKYYVVNLQLFEQIVLKLLNTIIFQFILSFKKKRKTLGNSRVIDFETNKYRFLLKLKK